MRLMVGMRRQADKDGVKEQWVEYIKRATHSAEELFASHKSTNWIQMHFCRKRTLLVRMLSSEDSRWSQQVLSWIPLHGLKRSIGRPRLRWHDDMDENE